TRLQGDWSSDVCSSDLFGKEKFQRSGPIHLDHGGEKWAEKTLRKLSLEEKIGQLFMIWVRAEFLNMNSPEYLQFRDQMQKYHVRSEERRVGKECRSRWA